MDSEDFEILHGILDEIDQAHHSLGELIHKDPDCKDLYGPIVLIEGASKHLHHFLVWEKHHDQH